MFGCLQQTLGGIRTAIEDYVFHPFAQGRLDLVIDCELAGIHDAHVHTRPDRVIEEHGVHRLAHRLIATE